VRRGNPFRPGRPRPRESPRWTARCAMRGRLRSRRHHDEEQTPTSEYVSH
jgi:hypothetical protein